MLGFCLVGLYSTIFNSIACVFSSNNHCPVVDRGIICLVECLCCCALAVNYLHQLPPSSTFCVGLSSFACLSVSQITHNFVQNLFMKFFWEFFIFWQKLLFRFLDYSKIGILEYTILLIKCTSKLKWEGFFNIGRYLHSWVLFSLLTAPTAYVVCILCAHIYALWDKGSTPPSFCHHFIKHWLVFSTVLSLAPTTPCLFC